MGILYYILHPNQARSIVQWKVWHDPVHTRDPTNDTPSLKSCFQLLNLTSRSFSAVIQELHPELLVPVTLFYLVLRGLDTIEDDQTLELSKKEPLLRNFHEHLKEVGWTFNESGPNEKDRSLLVHFDDVITELGKIKEPYFEVIRDITIKMGNGMADFAVNAEFNKNGVEHIKQYEQYCHYVAGLVGEGVTRLFVQAELANPRLLERPSLTESMGQFLQKTNIIRDVREDFDDGRNWWPREIWSQYFDKYEDIFKPENRERALHLSSHMVLNALKHVEECLFYMAGVKEQSVFNFVAIPQTMAIATLELVFRNPAMFDRNIKITKGDACQIMTESTQNLFVVCEVFRRYARRIRKKNDPRDPNYMAISLQCARIDQFIESIYPRQTADKMQKIYNQKKGMGSAMDVSDGAMLVLVVVLAILFIAGLMIATAWGANLYFAKHYANERPMGQLQWPGKEEL